MVRPLQSVSFPILLKQPQTHQSNLFPSSLAPKYEELAALYASHPVTIAKVDATANDVPDEISGFPTIKLFAAGAKSSPIEYNGDRTIEDIAKFVKENGKFKIDVYADKGKSAGQVVMDAGESMGHAAPAATEVVKESAAEATEKATEKAKETGEGAASKVSEVLAAVKTAVMDSDGDQADHDEL